MRIRAATGQSGAAAAKARKNLTDIPTTSSPPSWPLNLTPFGQCSHGQADEGLLSVLLSDVIGDRIRRKGAEPRLRRCCPLGAVDTAPSDLAAC
jgi:hypothetical protein